MLKCKFCHKCFEKIISLSNHQRWHSKKFRKMVSEKCRYSKLEEKNPNWKGDKVGIYSLHEWIKNRFPKPKRCQKCKLKPPIDLANISQEYKRDLLDWEWLCRRCHMIKDGRMKNLKQYSRIKSVQGVVGVL